MKCRSGGSRGNSPARRQGATSRNRSENALRGAVGYALALKWREEWRAGQAAARSRATKSLRGGSPAVKAKYPPPLLKDRSSMKHLRRPE